MQYVLSRCLWAARRLDMNQNCATYFARYGRLRVTLRIGIREGSADDVIGVLYRSRTMGRWLKARKCLIELQILAVIASILRAPAPAAGPCGLAQNRLPSQAVRRRYL